MDNSTKILIGSVATALLSLGAHTIGSTGSSFVDTLEGKTQYELSNAGLDAVAVNFERDPAITRNAVLSGDVTEDQRNKALSLAENIPGIGNVRWADDASGDGASDDGASDDGASDDGASGDDANAIADEPADKAVVAKCQSDINSITEGKNINFRSGSFYVPPTSFGLLDEIAAAIKPCKGVKLEVQGHTDLTGKADVNQRLSDGRAASVRDELIKRGLDPDRIVAKGYGSTQPVENARTSAANAKNRRTIFVIS